MKVPRRSFGWLLPLFLWGCSKPATENPEPAARVTVQAETATQGAQPPSSPSQEAVLAELTQAVRKYGAEKQRVPKDLNELVAAGYLSSIPAAPAGKRFAIDKQMRVYLAD